MSQKIASRVAGFIFAIIAIAHLVRLVLSVQITINGVVIPQVVSTVGFIIAFVMSVWMFLASKD